RCLTAIQTRNKTPHPLPPQPSRNLTIRRVFTQPGSHPAVPLASGGRLLSDVKLKQQVQEPTLGLEGRLAPEKSGRTPWRPRTAGCSPQGDSPARSQLW